MTPTERTEYLPAQRLDIYRGRAEGVVLLWHGRTPDSADELGALASAVAARGWDVYVPDWRSDGADRGRGYLLASLEFVRSRIDSKDEFVLAGWSRGGSAAAAFALNPDALGGWRPDRTVCLAAGFHGPDVLTDRDWADVVATAPRDAGPITLVHGTADEVNVVGCSRDMAAQLSDRGIPVSLVEIPVLHAGVVLARYDPDLRRCVPADEVALLRAAAVSIEAIVGRDTPGIAFS